jgi:two-component system, cell cycle sensor histidine kinase and response regulator CckA
MKPALEPNASPRTTAGGRARHSLGATTVGLSALLILLPLWLMRGNSRLGTRLVQSSFDLSLVFAEPFSTPLTNSPVAVVYLDLQSYQRESQDPARLWDRALHARLVDRLARAGARAIVFDIIFSGPGPDPAADAAFAEAMRANRRVVLGAELAGSSRVRESAGGVQALTLVLPAPSLCRAAAAWGIAHSRIDDDYVVRRHFLGFPSNHQPSLVWAAAQLLDLPATADPAFPGSDAWIRYYGPPFSLPHVSYSDALDPTAVPDAFFRDRVIFVGARPMTALFPERRDETRSPYLNTDQRELFHPGVEVHAIQMLNLMRGDWLTRPPAAWETVLFALLGISAAIGLTRLPPWPGAMVAISALTLISLGAVVAVQHGVWFPWLLAGAVQLPLAFTGGLVHHSVDWFRERRRLESVRRQAERKIREQAALIDKAHDAILLADLEGNLTYVNPGAVRLYGGSLTELQQAGRNGRGALVDSAGAIPKARVATLNQGEWSGELDQRTLGGDPVVVESRWTLIREARGEARAILIINTDVTEKKRIEAQFLRSQRLDTIGSLASGMVHDLNNALAPILMGLQILHRRSPDHDIRRMLKQMETNTHRCAELVRQVLVFSRGREGTRQILEIGPLIQEMENLLRETLPPNIRLQTLLPDDLWSVSGDPTQLHQLLLNLCVNARDAMTDGGTLTLAADNVEPGASPHPLPEHGAYIMLLVSDTGTGIPPGIRDRVFEPFFTTKPDGHGTGLGLSTVASVVKNHGGLLKMESEPGVGTTFEIYLPKAEEPVGMLPDRAPEEIPRGREELVLVIDDEVSILDMLSTALQEQGYRTVTATNGIEAMGLLRQRGAELRLVVLDRLMPGPEGLEILMQIRRIHPELPVILVSGQQTDRQHHELEGLQRVALLSKPFRLEDLFRLVHNLTDS